MGVSKELALSMRSQEEESTILIEVIFIVEFRGTFDISGSSRRDLTRVHDSVVSLLVGMDYLDSARALGSTSDIDRHGAVKHVSS